MAIRFGAAAIVLTAGLSVVAQEDRIEVVLPRDAIPAIDDPEFEEANRANRLMADNELIIGLAGDSEQRAYSTWQLDRHVIVNDVFRAGEAELRLTVSQPASMARAESPTPTLLTWAKKGGFLLVRGTACREWSLLNSPRVATSRHHCFLASI